MKPPDVVLTEGDPFGQHVACTTVKHAARINERRPKPAIVFIVNLSWLSGSSYRKTVLKSLLKVKDNVVAESQSLHFKIPLDQEGLAANSISCDDQACMRQEHASDEDAHLARWYSVGTDGLHYFARIEA